MYLRHERKTATSQAMYLSLKQQDDREDQPSNSPQKVTSSDIKSNKRKHNASLYTARNTKERESERRKNSLPTQSWRPGWYPYVFVEWKCKSSCSYRWWWYDLVYRPSSAVRGCGLKTFSWPFCSHNNRSQDIVEAQAFLHCSSCYTYSYY